MEFEVFKNKFLERVEGIETDDIDETTKILELEGWDSLTYMSMLVMLEEEYGVELSQNEFDSIDTMGALFEYVKKNK